MSYVDLVLAKKHLAVTHSLDDELIQQYIDAAESYAASFMGRRAITDEQDPPWGGDCASSSEASSSDEVVPAAVVQAILLLVGDSYALREASVVGTIYAKNPAAENLLHMYRVGLGV